MSNSKHEPEIKFQYTFEFPDGRKKEFDVHVHRDTMGIISPVKRDIPDWAKLTEFKCEHCPLDEHEIYYCPLALNLIDILDAFNDELSYEMVDITVKTTNRDYHKKTALQVGISSLLGIMMVTSGCPIIGKLKPLLYFHLPFATLEETQVRAFSIYLLAQHLKKKRNEVPDWEMKNLEKIYDDIRILNHNVSKKIVNLSNKDASINSLVILNNFADYVMMTLSDKTIDELEYRLSEFF
ncbi:MAG: hypothetical protein FJ213_07200 [Ignavibacteria bacterium]|nr:hypothetical protein [Ignavibacteria bacterium]